MNNDLNLIPWDKLKFQIETSKDIEQLSQLTDKLKAYKILAEQSKQSAEVQIKITNYLYRAERKQGEWLKDNIEHGGDRKSKSHDDTLKLRDAGITKNESSRLQKIANISDEVFEKILNSAEQEVKKVTKNMLVTIGKEIENSEKINSISKKTETIKPINNKYDVIVIDPPWEMEKIKRDCAPEQVGFDYPTMTIDEIKSFKLPHADDCHIFLWITQKYLPQGFEILESWGSKYVVAFVWHKNGGFQPFNLPQYNCEFVLYARIGTPKFSDLKNFNTCFNANRSGHSKKPDEFYEMIRRVTDGSRIDIFNRRKINGFDTWGNECQ